VGLLVSGGKGRFRWDGYQGGSAGEACCSKMSHRGGLAGIEVFLPGRTRFRNVDLDRVGLLGVLCETADNRVKHNISS